jgi:ABC-2 type transport system ATP-binding protein
MPAIEVKNLTKRYGRKGVTALDGISLSVNKGEIFGVIGPNGAGKTTLVKILLAIVRPTDGTARVFGQSPGRPDTRARVGFLPEDVSFPRFLTGERVLRFYGGLSGVSGSRLKADMAKTLEILELASWRRQKVKNYSRGMQQKLGICQALLGDPKLLFLDEPTSGVDPMSRRKIRDLLAELKGRGITILMNSHLLSEIEMVCDRIAIMKGGRIIRLGTLDELTSDTRAHRIRVDRMTPDLEEVLTDCVGPFSIEGKNCFMIDIETSELLNETIDRIRSLKINILEIAPMKQTLEDIFVKVVEEDEVAH